jgi:Porin PorA
MRRVTWVVLIGLGAFFVVLAVLCRLFLPGQLVKFPLNEYAKGVLTGSDVSYFSTQHLRLVTGVNVRAINTVRGDVAAAASSGNSDVAVWQSFLAVRDATNNVPILYGYSSLAFNRRTGQLVNCCGNVVGKNRNVHVSGQGFVLPFNAQPRDYQLYDTTLLAPVPFRYAGAEKIDGLATYKFVEQVNNRQVGTQPVPGSLVGSPASSVTLPEYYSITRAEWVDPVTGTPVKVTETQNLALEDASGATRLLLFHGSLATQPGAVSTAVSADKSKASLIRLVEVTGPIVLGVLGVLALGAGLFFAWRRPEEEEVLQRHAVPVGSAP